MKRAATVVFTCILAGVGRSVPAHVSGIGPQNHFQLFAQYALTGETGPAVFETADDFVAMLKSSGNAWIKSAPTAEQERRRNVLALLAIETAGAATSSLRDGFLMIEWACDLLRKGPPTAFERRWMLASSSRFLRREFEANYSAQPGFRNLRATSHLSHAADRFPREVRLRLMRLLQRPEAYTLASRPGADLDHLVRLPFANSGGPRGRSQVANTIAALAELVDDVEVGAEARAHIGLLKFHLNQLPESLADFTHSTRSTADPFVANLASIGMGLVLDAQGRLADAAVAYRSAVEAMPAARASAIQLAAHLYLVGERDDASQVVDAAFGPDALDLEPWRHIIAPDRMVPADLAWLRAALNMPAARPAGQSVPRLVTDPAIVSGPSQAVVPSSPASTHQAGQPTFRSRANAVVLDVLVESNRVPVGGLTNDDFEVLDNGQRQTVDVVQVDTVPIDVSLVVDFFNETWVEKFTLTKENSEFGLSTSRASNRVQSPAVFRQTRQDMLDMPRALKLTDRLRVLQVDGQVGGELWPLQRPPFPVERLPDLPIGSLGQETAQPQSTYGRMQGLYDVVTAALLRQTPPDRRHIVVVFTDGVDGASVLTPTLFLAVARESMSVMYLARRDTQDEIALKLEIKRATPYAKFLWPPDPHVIEKAAESTGGSVYYHPSGTLLPDFKEIFDRFRRSYVVRYQPTTAASGWHDVSIRITRAGKYDVKARKGYTVK